MRLPREQRAEIARELIASLDELPGADHDGDTASVEEAWLVEVERRMAAIDQDESIPIPWETVRDRIMARLRAPHG